MWFHSPNCPHLIYHEHVVSRPLNVVKKERSQMSKKTLSLGTFYNETQIPNKINTWNIWSKALLWLQRCTNSCEEHTHQENRAVGCKP